MPSDPLPALMEQPARPWLPWLAAGVVLGALAPEAVAIAWGWRACPLMLLAGIGLPLAGLAAWRSTDWPWAARGFLLLAATTLGMALGWTDGTPVEAGPRLLAVEGEVVNVLVRRDGDARPASHHADSQRFIIATADRRLYVRAPALPAAACGDRVLVRGLWEQGMRGEALQAVAIERLATREDGARGWAWRALGRLERRRELGESLLLGQGSPAEKDDFRRSGLLHILAVSGSHLAIAAALGMWLLRIAGLSWGLRQAALGLLIIGYAWLTGGNPATLRALAMGLAVLAMGLTAREPHRLAAVALAATVLVVADPANARSLGFLLSLCAVLGIVTLGVDLVHLRERWLPLGPWPLDRIFWRMLLGGGRIACDGLAIGIGATLATAPLIAWTFGTANPWSPLTTLGATPPTAAALWLGLPLMVLAGCWPGGPWDGLYAGVEGSLDLLADVVRWSAELPGATLHVTSPGWLVLMAWPLLFLPLTSGAGAARRLGLLATLLLAWAGGV